MEYKRHTIWDEMRGCWVIKDGKSGDIGYCDSSESVYVGETIDRLAELEDKIEQGTLIELPCKVGDLIWVVCGTISEYQISEFWYDGLFFVFKCVNVEYVEEHRKFSFFHERIGKTVFLTREEAEKRLKELQE